MLADSPPRRGSPQGCPAPGTAPANKWCAGLRSEPHRATKTLRCAGASASTGVGQLDATTEVFSSPIPPNGKMPRGGPDIRPRKPKPGGVRGPNSQLGGDPRSSLGCPSKRLRSRFHPRPPKPTSDTSEIDCPSGNQRRRLLGAVFDCVWADVGGHMFKKSGSELQDRHLLRQVAVYKFWNNFGAPAAPK
mgnify:CR=1 FL=1